MFTINAVSLVCSLMPLARWISTVTTVEPLRKSRSQGITRRLNMLCGDFISFKSSSIGVRSRYAKYTRTWIFQIRWQNPFHSPSMRGTQEQWVLDTFWIDSSASGRLLEICPRGNHISLYSWLTKCSLNIHGWQLVLINAYVKYLWNSSLVWIF